MLNAKKYAEIYNSASAEFKRTTTEQQWVALCSGARQKLGRWKQSTVKDTQVLLVDSGGHIVIVDYATDFETGPATERLVFFVQNGHAQLHGYNVNSPSLSRVDAGGNLH